MDFNNINEKRQENFKGLNRDPNKNDKNTIYDNSEKKLENEYLFRKSQDDEFSKTGFFNNTKNGFNKDSSLQNSFNKISSYDDKNDQMNPYNEEDCSKYFYDMDKNMKIFEKKMTKITNNNKNFELEFLGNQQMNYQRGKMENPNRQSSNSAFNHCNNNNDLNENNNKFSFHNNYKLRSSSENQHPPFDTFSNEQDEREKVKVNVNVSASTASSNSLIL